MGRFLCRPNNKNKYHEFFLADADNNYLYATYGTYWLIVGVNVLIMHFL